MQITPAPKLLPESVDSLSNTESILPVKKSPLEIKTNDEADTQSNDSSLINPIVIPKYVMPKYTLPICTNQCVLNERQCAIKSENEYQVCSDTNGDGCVEWTNKQPCPDGAYCLNGYCLKNK